MENLLLDLLTEDKIDVQQDRIIFVDGYGDIGQGPGSALLYTRFLSPRAAARFLQYEQKKGIQYCELKGYNLYAIAESIGYKKITEDLTVKKILNLAKKAVIDSVILTSVGGFSQCQEDTFWFLDKLYEYGVRVELIGCGSLDKAIFDAYIEESKKQQNIFQNMLTSFVSQAEMADHIC
ncbi:hypothetical protein K040078D81_43930 [Blautia hominis]|uniref:Uncharacterized protein n=1 Tax=Blautia hominis TaxID=2025493 RepID=A0ABQ0BFN8_9FIRM